ncbi:MAG: hypothetical protein PVG71_11850, partial [Anaerolineae bacterium]
MIAALGAVRPYAHSGDARAHFAIDRLLSNLDWTLFLGLVQSPVALAARGIPGASCLIRRTLLLAVAILHTDALTS